MTTHLILVLEESAYNPMIETMFDDLRKQHSLHTIIENSKLNIFEDKIKSIKVQNLTKGIFNPLFCRKTELELFLENNYIEEDDYIILFLNSSFLRSKPPVNSFCKIKKKYEHIKFILFYIDIINSPQSKQANYLMNNNIFDLVYTVDKKDSETYNLCLWNTPYSKNIINSTNSSYNLYFCGGRKNRGPLISDILTNCKKNNIEVEMDVIYGDDDYNILKEHEDIIRLHKEGNFLSYRTVLNNTIKTKCILDIVQDGQLALTLRPYEAVVYNKKLLTNNRSIFEFKYYDPKFMKYFESVEDIDWQWLNSDEIVNYSYNNDFSPILLIDDIIKRLNDNDSKSDY